MKVALAQLDVQAGRPRKNVKRMVEMIREAKLEDADLIAFPEMAVSGYLVGDKWTDDSWCRNLMEYNEMLREASEDIIVVYGNVFLDDKLKGRDGRAVKFNSAYCVENKKIIGIRHKTLLPTYRIFDDSRYFANPLDFGIEPTPVELSNGIKIGLEVCEDMWVF